jgi:hypothetical protein
MSQLGFFGVVVFFVLVIAAYLQLKASIHRSRLNARREKYRDRGIDGFDINEDFGNRRG